MRAPIQPKIYHIVHVDRLPFILSDGRLWCDAEVGRRAIKGTTIGMNNIKHRRLNQLMLSSHPNLHVGDCVPFYFCPRSVMLYLIWRANNPDLNYRGGQEPIVHLESDLSKTVSWANENKLRWAFTLSNAGSCYFEDRCNLTQLHEIDWEAVNATQWSGRNLIHSGAHGKQAEFLVEHSFPWHLVERIGVQSRNVYQQTAKALAGISHRPIIEIKLEWYY